MNTQPSLFEHTHTHTHTSPQRTLKRVKQKAAEAARRRKQQHRRRRRGTAEPGSDSGTDGREWSVLQRVLDARQLGLKLLSNVTYGYTSAGFSGRMPMAELADAIVQMGRSTLERAIEMVNTHESWRARVVYGDTDSMFVNLPGRSKEEAFQIGAEIAKAVTDANPHPVTLKLEKVYTRSVLVAKKRLCCAALSFMQ